MFGSKGQYDLARKALYYIVAIFVIAVIFLYMHNAIANYNNTVVSDASKIEGSIIAVQALMSPKCFAYYDEEIGRTYPGIIDMEKFNNRNLGRNCMVYIESPYSFLFGGNKVTKGTGNLEKIFAPVLIWKNGKLKPEVIEIGVEDYYINENQVVPRK